MRSLIRYRRLGSALRVVQALGFALVLGGIATLTAAANKQDVQNPLDDYPGFGRSPEAASRDNTIAYWEAFRREQAVGSCMAESGFEYWADVAFPSEAMLAIAHDLGIEAGPEPLGIRPGDANRAYELSLSASERDRFNLALFGESAADIAEANRTGQIPAGRVDDFAVGGCAGKASTSPSIWDLRRALADDYAAMHRATFSSTELETTRAEYKACAEKNGGIAAADPAMLDELLDLGRIASQAFSAITTECGPIWASGYRQTEVAATERFVRQHEDALGAVKERYQGVLELIHGDAEFLDYLSEQVALAPVPVEDQPAEGH